MIHGTEHSETLMHIQLDNIDIPEPRPSREGTCRMIRWSDSQLGESIKQLAACRDHEQVERCIVTREGLMIYYGQ